MTKKLIIIFLNLILNFFSYGNSSSCVDLNVLIQLPDSKRPGCSDYGHSGIGIGNRYYDYGPNSQKTLWRILASRGGPHWDNAVDKKRDASYEEILKFVKKNWTCPVKVVHVKIDKHTEDELIDFWERLYQNPGTFSALFGRVCTTMVYRSLRKAHLLPFGTKTYTTGALLHRSLKYLKNTCGKDAGKSASEITYIP